MKNNAYNTPLHKRQCKIKGFRKEEQTIFYYLKNTIATASMITRATGVNQKNICRYKSDLEKRNLLFEVYKRPCKITGRLAWYLTTNISLLRKEVKNGK